LVFAILANYCSHRTGVIAAEALSMKSRLATYAAARAARHESIIDTIGNTPIIRLQRMAPEGVNVYVKLESENPGGSLKDRLAYGVIEWAEKHGKLKPGQVCTLDAFGSVPDD